ncbi:MAG: cytochrome P450 [Trueperaceae bacterium]|nr:MAG: cytochrome P450 [Trueperaceae bacterium]
MPYARGVIALSGLPPGPPPEYRIRGGYLDGIVELQRRYGDVFTLQFGRRRHFVLCHSDLAYEVLVKESASFVKLGSFGARSGLQAVLGSGLLTNPDFDSWFSQRKLLLPLFKEGYVATLAGLIAEAGLRLRRRWSRLPRGAQIDIVKEMMRVSQEIIYRSIFSLSPEEALRHPISVPLSLATASAAEVRRVRGELEHVVLKLIARRQAEHRRGEPLRGDLLDLMMTARHSETGEVMALTQLLDEILTLFSAGHETTASVLVWCCWLLACHPEVAERLTAAIGSRDGTDLYSAMGEIPFLEAVIDETLRLFPAIPTIPRVATRESLLGGYSLPQGARVLVSIYAIGRHPELWTDAERFIPGRFLDRRFRAGFMPFGLGQRYCIGRNLALVQARLLLAILIPHFVLKPVSGTVPDKKVAVSLLPKSDLRLRLWQR